MRSVKSTHKGPDNPTWSGHSGTLPVLRNTSLVCEFWRAQNGELSFLQILGGKRETPRTEKLPGMNILSLCSLRVIVAIVKTLIERGLEKPRNFQESLTKFIGPVHFS
jgi:hypothetical protein